MNDETKSIEKQISELLEAHRTKTGTCIFKIKVVWAIPFISKDSKNGEVKIEALRIDSRTNTL